MVRETGIEPVRVISPQDFKSCASACSATRAYAFVQVVFCNLQVIYYHSDRNLSTTIFRNFKLFFSIFLLIFDDNIYKEDFTRKEVLYKWKNISGVFLLEE